MLLLLFKVVCNTNDTWGKSVGETPNNPSILEGDLAIQIKGLFACPLAQKFHIILRKHNDYAKTFLKNMFISLFLIIVRNWT